MAAPQRRSDRVAAASLGLAETWILRAVVLLVVAPGVPWVLAADERDASGRFVVLIAVAGVVGATAGLAIGLYRRRVDRRRRAAT